MEFYSLELYDCLFLILYMIHLTLLLAIPSWQIITHQFPVVSSAIILAEQVGQQRTASEDAQLCFSCDN